MQYNATTGQIANLSEAKSQKIIDEVRFYEPEGNRRIPYSRIAGSPFWRDEFLPAKIYTTTGHVYAASIRLNLATNKIHFLEKGEEMEVIELNVNKIILYQDNDSACFLTNISRQFVKNKNEEGFVQILNKGNYQLLKYTKRTVGSADSLFRTQKRYFFADEINYFLRFNEKVETIKRLSKDNITKLLPSVSSYTTWISQNNIDFKKECDVIHFLNYYNDTHIIKGD
jgi:hypothetical protein